MQSENEIKTAEELLPMFATLSTLSTHVSKLEMSKLWNDGNYENTRVSITVDVNPSDDPLKQLRKLEFIFGNLRARAAVSRWNYDHAKEALAMNPEEMLKKFDERRIAQFRQEVADYESIFKRRELARQLLRTFAHTIEESGVQKTWEEFDLDADLKEQ
jgi:hypothetical protein